MPRKILITGIGGFIGSHFADYFLRHTNCDIIGIDSFRHKGTYSRLNDVLDSLRHPVEYSARLKTFFHDFTAPVDGVLWRKIYSAVWSGGTQDEVTIINLASNSAVERSITDPSECWRNNCELILHTLELAKALRNRLHSFIHISTDEVYGDAMSNPTGHKEWDRIVPSNPYSASKAAQEALAISYWRTYDLPIVLVNCMNCIGERQDKEKFLPKIVHSIHNDKTVPIYCNKDGIPGSRVYLDCQNHASAINFIINNTAINLYRHGEGDSLPSRYNICGETELDNLEFATLVAKAMHKVLEYNKVNSESIRPGYDRRYFLDGSLLRNLGWEQPYTFDETLQRIVKHALTKPEWI